jgi:hypothetical protein
MSNDWAPPHAGQAPPPPPRPPVGGDYVTEVRSGRGRSRAKIIVPVVAIAALLTGGGLAAVALTGSGSGGADSPEAAVAALMDAIAAEDSLGALDAMVPAERDLVVDAFTEVPGELRRLGLWDEGGETWADVTFDGLTYATEELRDGVAAVEITGGTASVAYDWSKLPIGDTVVEELLDGEAPSGSAVESESMTAGDEPLRVVAVEHDGGWYVSMFTTVAELARVEAGLDMPAESIAAIGSDTPEEAVTAMVDAVAALDARRIIELLPPEEMDVLHDYGPLFVDDLADTGSLTIDRLVLGEVSVDGDTARVPITELAGSAEVDGEAATFELADGCLRTEIVGFDGAPEISEQCDEQIAAQTVVTAVREGGQWYVSPARTLVDGLVAALREVEPQQVEDALSGLSDLFLFGDTADDPFGSPFASPVDAAAEQCYVDTDWPADMTVEEFNAEVRECVLAQGFDESELPEWLFE